MQTTFSVQELWMVALITLLYISGMIAAALVGIYAWKNNKDEKALVPAIGLLVGNTNFLRIATVLLVIYSALVLGVLNKLDAGISSLLSGLAGYVLGGLPGSQHTQKDV